MIVYLGIEFLVDSCFPSRPGKDSLVLFWHPLCIRVILIVISLQVIYLFSLVVLFVCLFVCLFSLSCTQGMWKFPGQGSNPCHSRNLCHSCGNARYLTGCTTGELPSGSFKDFSLVFSVQFHNKMFLGYIHYYIFFLTFCVIFCTSKRMHISCPASWKVLSHFSSILFLESY